MPFTNLNHANLGKKIEDKKEIFAEIDDADDNNAIVISDFSDSNINVRLSFELNSTTKKQEENFALHKQFSLTSKNFTLYFIKQLLYKCFPNCNVAERKEIESFLEQLKKQRTIPNIFQYSFTLWPSFIRKQIGKNSHGDLYEILSRYIAKTQPDEWTEDKKVEFLKDTLCNYADGFLHNKQLKESDIQLLATWVAAYNQDKIFKCLIPKDSSLEGYPYIKDLYDSKNKNIFGRAFKGFIQELTTKVVSPVPTSTVTKSEKRESLATVPQHISDIKLTKQSATTVVSPASCVNLYDLLFDRNLVTTFINALTEGRFSKEKVLELLETTLYNAIVADQILLNELLDTKDSTFVVLDKDTKNNPFWGTESYIDDLGRTLPCMNFPGQALTHVRARIRNEMALSSPKVQPQPAASIATTTPVTPLFTPAAITTPVTPLVTPIATTTPVTTSEPVTVLVAPSPTTTGVTAPASTVQVANTNTSSRRTNEQILEEDFGFSKDKIEEMKVKGKRDHGIELESLFIVGPKRKDIDTKNVPEFHMLFDPESFLMGLFQTKRTRKEYIDSRKLEELEKIRVKPKNKTNISVAEYLASRFSKYIGTQEEQDKIIADVISEWTKAYLQQNSKIAKQWKNAQRGKTKILCINEYGKQDFITGKALAPLTGAFNSTVKRTSSKDAKLTTTNNNNAKASTSTPVSVTPVVVSASMASTTPAISQPPQPVSVNFAADKGINTTLDEWLAAHPDYVRINEDRSDALDLVWRDETSGKKCARIVISYAPDEQRLSFGYASSIKDKNRAEKVEKINIDDAEELMSQIETKNLASFEDTMSNAHLNGRTFIGKDQPPTTSPPTTASPQATPGTPSPTPFHSS